MVLPFFPSFTCVIPSINASLFASDESKYSVSPKNLIERLFFRCDKALFIVRISFFNFCILINLYCFQSCDLYKCIIYFTNPGYNLIIVSAYLFKIFNA